MRIREVLTVRVPGRLDLSGETRDERGPASRLRREVTVKGSVARIEWTYESLSDRVAAKDVARHATAIRSMRDLSSITLPLFIRPSREAERSSSYTAAWVAGSVVVAGVALLVGGPRFADWVSRRRARRFARKTRARLRQGESVSNPARVSGIDEALDAATRGRCTCGGSFPRSSTRTEMVRYGGEDVALTTVSCERCPSRRSFYWLPPAAPP